MKTLLTTASRAFREAVHAPIVWIGFAGSVCILLGSLSPAYLPQASPVWDLLRYLNFDGQVSKWVGTVLTLLGLGLLVEAWLQLRPARRAALGLPRLRHWAVLLVVSAPLLLAPPVFSHDAYSYAAQGWLLHNNINPYEVGPGVLPGQFADQVAWEWRQTPAPYGPLALRLSQFLVNTAGFDPIVSTLLQRIPALIGVGLIGWCVPRVARWMHVSPAAASWFAVLNPILVMDFIGGMHNDSLMVGLMIFGIWTTMRLTRRSERAPLASSPSRQILPWVLGGALIGLAASIKQPAFLAALGLPFLCLPWTKWTPGQVAYAVARALACLGVAVAVFAAISNATGLGFGWLNAVYVPGTVDTFSPTTVLGYLIQWPLNLTTFDPSGRIAIMTMRTIGWIVFAVGVVILALVHLGRRPLHFTSWSYILFGFAAPALHSWYLLWGGVMFPMTRPRQQWLRFAIVATCVLLSYAALNFSIRNGPWLLALVMIAALALSLLSHELTQNWDETLEEQQRAS